MTKNTWGLVATTAIGLAGFSSISAAPKNGPIPVVTTIASSVDGVAARVQGDGDAYMTTSFRKTQTVYSAIDRFSTGRTSPQKSKA